MFRPITKWTARVERLKDIPETLAKASHVARSGRPAPLHVELPRVSDYSDLSYKKSPHPSLNTNDVGRLSLSLLRAMSAVAKFGGTFIDASRRLILSCNRVFGM